jgi:hypothetical protein
MEGALFFIEDVNHGSRPFSFVEQSSRDVAPPTVFLLRREMR